MRIRSTICSLAALGCAASAEAAVTVFGNTQAHQCYLAADRGRSDAGALGICNRALEDRSLTGRDRVASFVNRGILHVLGGRIDRAIADYDRAIALDPGEPDAYLNKGLALLRTEEGAAEAVQLITAAIDRGTSEPAVAYYSRAVAHEMNGDIVAAYNDLLTAERLAPGWEAPVRDLARFEVQ